MWRFLLWLIPEFASIPASEREPMDRVLIFAAIGVLMSGLAITGLEMLLELLVPSAWLVPTRPVVFMLYTVVSAVAISRVSYAKVRVTYVGQAEMKAAMHRQMRHDPLTDLPNRMCLQERAESVLAKRSADEALVLMMIDLDEFKRVNDRLGHAQGDVLLQEIARRLLEAIDVDRGDLAARLSGDEFVILSERVTSDADAQGLVERVRTSIEVPLILAGERVGVSASVGLATFPRDGLNLDTLLHAADVAMYHRKFGRRGGDRVA
jgi:diguanylate cyclase (GGDEF)-like protein